MQRVFDHYNDYANRCHTPNGASAAADRYADLKDRQQEFVTTAAPVPTLMDRIRSAFTQAAPFIELVKGAFMGIAALFTGMGLVSLFQGLGLAVATLVSPMGLLVAGAAALGLAWQTNFGGLRTITTEVFASIQTTVQTAWGIITGWFRENGEQVVTFLRDAWGRIEGIVRSVLEIIQGVIQLVMGNVKTFLEQHGEEIKGVLTKAWETIQLVISTALAIIEGVIIPFFRSIVDFFIEHKELVTGILGGAWTIIKGIVEAGMSVIQGVIKTVTAIIHGDWSGAWTAIKDMFSGIWGGIKDVVSGAITIVKDTLQLAWEAIRTVAEPAWNWLKDFVGGIWDSIKQKIDDITSPLTNAVSGMWDKIEESTTTAWNVVKDTIVNTFNSVLGAVKGAINRIIGVVNDLINGANEVGSALGLGGIPLIPYLADGVKNWAGGLAFASEPWLGVEAMRTPGGDFALLPPGVSNIPRGAEVFTAKETRGMAARMRVPQGGMVGARGLDAAGGVTIINNYNYNTNVDAREAMNPAAIEAAAKRGAEKVIKDFTDKANILLKTKAFGK